MWRHGDVMIATVNQFPKQVRRNPSTILVRGEITGHCHRIEDPNSAILWQGSNESFIEVIAESARLIHEEHRPITLPKGLYRVWQQREYTPRAILRVID